MFRTAYQPLLFVAAAFLSSSLCFGQVEMQLRVRQLPGWDLQQREGRCQVRVWVDNRAEVRMRGDRIWITTLEGAKARDEGSECSHPLPFNSVGGFQVHQVAGRNPVRMAHEPSRGNNFTATMLIEDQQGGGDNYAFDVTWHTEGDVARAPAPFFDDVRACQDFVRQRFGSKNGRGAYLDFENSADRPGGNDRNRGRDLATIQGRGNARSGSESRDLTWSCVIDTQRGRVQSGDYRYLGGGVRMNNRQPLK